MSLRFQRLALILISLLILGTAALLILLNTKKNIVFFYTPTELLEQKISFGDKIRIGGYVKDSSLKKISLNQYEFKITDNKNDLLVFYQGILPDLFREGQGAVIEGLIENQSTVTALRVYAKHDENYMPASIKEELEKNNQWKKDYK